MNRNRFTSFLLVLFMVITLIIPAGLPAYAVDDPDAYTFDISNGDITVSKGTADTLKVTYGATQTTTADFPNTQEITITGTTTDKAIVVDGVTANITLAGVDIKLTTSNDCAFELLNNADVTLTLKEGSINSLQSGSSSAGLQVPTGSRLKVEGTGELQSTGGNFSAGIGGGMDSSGNITINGGTVTAIGNMGGAGIGGGSSGRCENITINGGTVTATGGQDAAGIGGGEQNGGTIIITGGTVTATGTSGGAGIGGGIMSDSSNITISGGTVTATGGTSGAGIGGGMGGSPGNIIIDSNATVKAVSTVDGLAIQAVDDKLEDGSTARVLMANFTNSNAGGKSTDVYLKNEALPCISFSPTIDYKSIALTVPADGTYQIIANDALQQHSDGTPSKDFVIDASRLKIFNNVVSGPNEDQSAPTGLAGVAPTSALNDGKISGTTTAMEFKLETADDSTYQTCSADVTTVGNAGAYVVRYAAKPGFNAGAIAAVTVPANSCTVTFNTNGGSSISQITTTAGNTITAPTAPTKSEYTFDGWYKDSGLSDKFDFENNTISANTMLYAKWKFNTVLREISGKITAITEVSESEFGYAISAAGDLLAVGSPYELLSNNEEDGAVYIYDLTKSEGQTGYERKITMTNNQNDEHDDHFGRDIDLISNENGTSLLVGAPNFINEAGKYTGAAFLYDLSKSEGDVGYETKIVPSDGDDYFKYGKYVALNDKYAIVGAYSAGSKGEGAVYVYNRKESNLQESEIKIMPTDGQKDDYFGRVLELEDNTLVVSAYSASDDTGAVYIYDLTKSPGDTGFEIKVVPADLQKGSAYGKSLALEGGILVVGAYCADEAQGSVYAFDISDPSNITQILKLKSSDIVDGDRYGRSVSLSKNNLVVGAYRANVGGKSEAGAAYLYDLSASNVFESEVKFVTDDLKSGDELGRAILIHDDYVFIGAADGDGDGDSDAIDPGAVYTSYTSIIRAEEVAVTFNTNEGSAIPPITITAGNTITAPTAPTKSGYTFDGWYKDNGLADKYDFANDTISANTTLYAKWNRNSSSGSHRSSNTSNTTQKIIVADVKKDGDDKSYRVTGTMKTSPKKVEVVVDKKSIKDSIKTAKKDAVVKVLVPKDKDEISAIFSVKDVEDMAEKELAISVETEKAIYELPTNDVKLDVVRQAFGEDVDTSKIEFEVIQKVPSSSMEKIIVETAEKEDVLVLMPSIDFEINANYRGKSVKIEKFKKYVTRKIALPDTVDASKITTATITKPDGTIYHVPTYVTQIDGTYYAVVNSLTNSTYTLIYNKKTFDDIDMWAKASIENMASRLVVEGETDLLFAPNKEMTRANFTKFVIKSLGLAPLDYIQYTDVAMDQDYAGYIQTASEYGIINGIGGGLFAPNANITREEAMTILYRIKDILDYEGNELNLDMTKFTDYVNVSIYAKDAVIWNVNSSVIKGKSAETLDPKANITKAEVATVLERILQRAELIQE